MITDFKKRNKKGFTLVELVIVIAVLAILAAIAIPTVSNVIKTANENVDTANAQTVELAIKSADAELQGGTWDGLLGTSDTTASTHDTLTVNDALAHEGITALPNAKVTGAVWRYLNGKVYLTTKTTGTVFNTDNSKAGLALVKDIIETD